VDHAAQLAVACGARLTVMSAYSRQEPSDSSGNWIATSAAAANDNVLAGQDQARAVGVRSVGGRTEAGDPASALLDVATDIGADLIVVGSRGMAAATRFLLGSVPNRVSHHAPCDVIIVRTGD
jgi:nucleotide-binding universal stress UspA family protein